MTVEVNAILEELNSVYPCREAQLFALSSVIGHASFPSPPAVCLTGFPTSGKSIITRAFLNAIGTKYVWVDCSETISSALLFDRIVNKLRGLGGRDLSRVKMLADINNFVVQVQRVLESFNGKVILVTLFACQHWRQVLAKAQYLVQLQPDSLFAVLARLPTLLSATAQLTVLFLTTSIPTRSLGGLPLPTIHFPSYSKPQLLKILNQHTPESLYTVSTPPTVPGDLDDDELAKIWEGLNSAVIDTYGPGTSLDVPTILALSSELWPEFVQPVIDAGIFDDESGELIFGRIDFPGLFAIGKRKGLFSGEERVKRQSTLTTTKTTGYVLLYLGLLMG
jgi:origin recognition complex subunit 5